MYSRNVKIGSIIRQYNKLYLVVQLYEQTYRVYYITTLKELTPDNNKPIEKELVDNAVQYAKNLLNYRFKNILEYEKLSSGVYIGGSIIGDVVGEVDTKKVSKWYTKSSLIDKRIGNFSSHFE